MKNKNSLNTGGNTVSAFLVMICTFISRLLGFFRIAVISAVFGAQGEADVINAVFAIPNNLRKLMAEGALSSSFIPVLSHSIVHDKDHLKTKNIVGNILAFQLSVLVPIILLSIIFSRFLIKYVLVEFESEALLSLAEGLFRYFIVYLFFISISAVLMGVLNSHGSFFIPAVTPILFSVSVILSIVFLHKTMGAYSMAFGVIAGGILQVIFQTPSFLKAGYGFIPDFNFKNEYFKKIFSQWSAVITASVIFMLNEQLAIRFSTGLEEGSASYLNYAIVFWQLPLGIFSVSIITVLFPKMSRLASINDTENLKASLLYGLKFLFILLIPSTVFLVFLGKEIIAVALQRYNFTAADTYETWKVLSFYSLGLFATGAFNLLQRYFYAIKDFKTPVKLAIVICIIDVIFSLVLKETSLRISGLALANTIAFSTGLIISLYLIYKKNGTLGITKTLPEFFKVIVSVIPALIIILAFMHFTGEWWKNGSSFKNLFMLAAAVIPSAASILLMFKLFNIDIINNILKGRKNE